MTRVTEGESPKGVPLPIHVPTLQLLTGPLPAMACVHSTHLDTVLPLPELLTKFSWW